MSNKNIKHPRLFKPLFFFTNVQKILYFFLKNPTGHFYDREISKMTGMSPAGTNLALRELAKTEILKREQKGRMFFYRLDSNQALVGQLKILQNLMELETLLNEIKQNSLKIILYGSAAKGTNLEESDIDLFVLTRKREEVQKRIHKYLISLKVRPAIHTPQEWAQMENKIFVEQVENGIVLWDRHES